MRVNNHMWQDSHKLRILLPQRAPPAFGSPARSRRLYTLLPLLTTSPARYHLPYLAYLSGILRAFSRAGWRRFDVSEANGIGRRRQVAVRHVSALNIAHAFCLPPNILWKNINTIDSA